MYNNLVCPCSWYVVSIMMNTSFFLACLLSKELRYIAVWICFYLSHPSHRVFHAPSWHFYSVPVPHVNFTVELSGVLSVVIVLVFSYEYFLIYTSLVYTPLYYWLETSSTDFFLFCLLERFLYSVHEYGDNIYSLEKTHLHPGQCVLLFHE